jgi:hypothetical protein
MKPLLETVGSFAEAFYKADAALVVDPSTQNVQNIQTALKNYREAQKREYSAFVDEGCAQAYLEWLDTVIADLANPGSRVEEKEVPPVPAVTTKARDQAFF